MLIWTIIAFAIIVYGLGHATRVWLRTDRISRDTVANATLLESGLLTREERQKMRDRLKEKMHELRE